MAYNIGRVREVAVRAAKPGWRGGRFCGRRDKDHLKRKAEGLQLRTLCYLTDRDSAILFIIRWVKPNLPLFWNWLRANQLPNRFYKIDDLIIVF